MPMRTGVINAVEPRRSLKDRGYLGMVLTEVSAHEVRVSPPHGWSDDESAMICPLFFSLR